jgi:ATP-dependent DNA helicase RecG
VVRAGKSDLPPRPRLARPPRRARPALDPAQAADTLRGLNAPVSVVKGVGVRMSKTFEKLGVYTVGDLLFFFPRRYDDYTQLKSINQLEPNTTATIIGTVQQAEVQVGRGGRRDFTLTLDDGSGLLNVVFFGKQFMTRYIKPGQQIVLSGEVTIFGSHLRMANPEWEHLDAENLHTLRIVPVYPLTEGLKARGLRRLIKTAVEYWAERLPDYMPEGTLERVELGDLGWTIKNLHFPASWDHLAHARRRFVFDQLLLLQLAMLGHRRDWQALPAVPLNISDERLEAFVQAAFPYALTGAQRRAIEDIRRDVAQQTPMNRLLQGDVGSGKTAVAAAALAAAVASGQQAALMAPTSILAEQHYRSISQMLAQWPGERKPVVALLTSALAQAEREAVYAGLADGGIDVVIGTHALIQTGVEFQRLALTVVDEQHRFGVEQRAALRGKGVNPHLLVMTATPIPRTLALTVHADLDLTVLNEMPPGRMPIDTRVIEPVARERIFSFVQAQLNEGRQAFIVHPLVEESERVEARAAVQAYEQLKQVFFRSNVGLLHGRMKPADKEDVMAAFSRGEYDVLVTTSVAEVGVDVPNASVIVIEGANRFGLAQLHQFRGRVGRGVHQSYCLLVPDSTAEDARERLEAMEKITDGFELAEIDWRQRGPGDLLGTRQSGHSGLRLAEEISPELVEIAQREARTIYAEDPYLEQPQHRLLAERVRMLEGERGDVS